MAKVYTKITRTLSFTPGPIITSEGESAKNSEIIRDHAKTVTCWANSISRDLAILSDNGVEVYGGLFDIHFLLAMDKETACTWMRDRDIDPEKWDIHEEDR